MVLIISPSLIGSIAFQTEKRLFPVITPDKLVSSNAADGFKGPGAWQHGSRVLKKLFRLQGAEGECLLRSFFVWQRMHECLFWAKVCHMSWNWDNSPFKNHTAQLIAVPGRLGSWCLLNYMAANNTALLMKKQVTVGSTNIFSWLGGCVLIAFWDDGGLSVNMRSNCLSRCQTSLVPIS